MLQMPMQGEGTSGAFLFFLFSCNISFFLNVISQMRQGAYRKAEGRSCAGSDAHLRRENARTRATRSRSSPCPLAADSPFRSEEHTSELQSRENLVCRLLLEKKNGHYHRSSPIYPTVL